MCEVKKYLEVFKQNLQYLLVHRGRVVIWVLNDSISFLVFAFIWLAVYGGRDMIAGYSKADIVTYFILVIFIKLAGHSHISYPVRGDIMEGRLNEYLVKPINFILDRFIREAGYKVFSSVIIIPLVLIIAIFLKEYVVFPPSIIYLLLFVLSVAMAFVLSSTVQFIIGFSTFWVGENKGLQWMNHLSTMLFSGKVAPLVFFPVVLQVVANYLPFKYMIYFPIQVYLGQIGIQEILIGFALMSMWILFFWGVVIFMWRRGLKKYEGVGI